MSEDSTTESPEELDTDVSENEVFVEKEEDTGVIDKEDKLKKIDSLTPRIEYKVNKMVEDFKQGKDREFKETLKYIILSCLEMNIRVSELEDELEEIKNEFYRNELSDKDFEDILMLDDENNE